MLRQILTTMIVLLLLVPTASAVTREESVLEFINETRMEDSGFANTTTDNVSLEATVNAMQIKTILADSINNSLDILYYFQRLQDSSGGFAPAEGSNPTIDATIDAIHGFQYLDVNQSQYTEWQIYPFLNETAQQILLVNVNGTSQLNNLTTNHLQLWSDYIVSASLIGNIPSFPILELIDGTKALQYPNGTYFDLPIALASIELLSTLGEVPRDPDLAKKYILSFLTSSGAFAITQDGNATLAATYQTLVVLDKLMDLYQLDTRTEITKFVFTQQKARSGFVEVGYDEPTVRSTLHAVLILQLLGELDELNAPDVLQEVGFLGYPWIWISLVLILPWLRRRYY